MNGKSWTGSLAETPFANVLAEMHRSKATGRLFCLQSQESRAVSILDGVPRTATSSSPDRSVGAELFRQGYASLQALEVHDDARLLQLAPEGARRQILQELALEVVLDTFTWVDGVFAFFADDDRRLPDHPIELGFGRLLTLGLKRVRSLRSLRSGVGDLHQPLAAITDASLGVLKDLPDEACVVLGAVRSCMRPAAESSVPWPPDGKVLLGIWQLRLLDLVRPAGAGEGIRPSALLSAAPRRAEALAPAAAWASQAPAQALRSPAHATGATQPDPLSGRQPAAAAVEPMVMTEPAKPLRRSPPPVQPTLAAAPPQGAPPHPVQAPSPARTPAQAPAPPRSQAVSVSAPPVHDVAEKVSVFPDLIDDLDLGNDFDPLGTGGGLETELGPAPSSDADGPVLGADGPALSADEPVLGADGPAPSADGPALGADGPALSADEPVLGADRPAPSVWNSTPDSVVTRLDTEDHGTATTGTRKVSDVAAEWFRSGERFLKQCDLHNAVTSFREAVELDPKNPVFRIRLGQTLVRNPKWRKEAEEHLLAAIELQPWDGKAHFALGKMYADAGLIKKAEARLRTAVETEPGNAQARKLLAEVAKSVQKEAGGASGFLGRLGITVGSSAAPKEPQPAPASDSEEIIEV